MLKDEADPTTEPQKAQKGNKSEFWLRLTNLFLLGIVILLGIGYFTIYSDYTSSKRKFSESYKKASTIINDNNLLQAEAEKLTSENNQLKQSNMEMLDQNKVILNQLQDFQSKYNELSKKVARLEEDNIALQNSLKLAASVGIKPQSYTRFNGISGRGSVDRADYMGKFLGTAYTPSKDECGNSKGITNSGKAIIPGVSIAIDSSYWPFGTVFYIKGLGYAVAMDTGNAIKGKNRFDFAVFDKKFAKILGEREWDVYLVKMGNGNVGDIKF